MAGNLSFSEIFIFHPGALGDGLLALSAVRYLRRHFSIHSDHSEIVWIGHSGLGRVLVQCGEVERAFSFETLNLEDPTSLKKIGIFSLASPKSNEDRIVGWINDKDGWWKNRCQNLGYSRVLFKSPRNPNLTSRHMEDRYLETLKEWHDEINQKYLGCIDSKPLKGLFPCPQMEYKGKAFLPGERLILLHPGSGSQKKCVPSEVFFNLAKMIMERSSEKVGLIGGPADNQSFETLRASLAALNPLCFQNLDLLSVCGVLKQAKIFIGHDSGLSHLAARLGVPSLLFFGPTDPAVWAPRGSHVRILRNVGLHFSPEEVTVAIESILQSRCFELVGN